MKKILKKNNNSSLFINKELLSKVKTKENENNENNKNNENNENNEYNKNNENYIRNISKYIINKIGFTDKISIIGIIYFIIHFYIIFFTVFILLFNNNLTYLTILLIIISFDALSIVILHGCPLTHLEQKYLNSNSSDNRREMLQKCGILYNCEHEYEKQIELLINVWCIITLKCLIIIFFKTFNIKLNNDNKLYIHP